MTATILPYRVTVIYLSAVVIVSFAMHGERSALRLVGRIGRCDPAGRNGVASLRSPARPGRTGLQLLQLAQDGSTITRMARPGTASASICVIRRTSPQLRCIG
jgi:hypothetical protein